MQKFDWPAVNALIRAIRAAQGDRKAAKDQAIRALAAAARATHFRL